MKWRISFLLSYLFSLQRYLIKSWKTDQTLVLYIKQYIPLFCKKEKEAMKLEGRENYIGLGSSTVNIRFLKKENNNF